MVLHSILYVFNKKEGGKIIVFIFPKPIDFCSDMYYNVYNPTDDLCCEFAKTHKCRLYHGVLNYNNIRNKKVNHRTGGVREPVFHVRQLYKKEERKTKK